MKVLQLSTFDGRFGASIAARRLHEALLSNGQECDLFVSEVLGDSPRTHGPRTGVEKIRAKVRLYVDNLPLRLYPQRARQGFSPSWMPSSMAKRVRSFQSDIIHMHWCQSNFVPTPVLPHLGKALIWTFHDMWAFTGGCHYTAGCDGYLTGCGRCPFLKSESEQDLSRWLWKQKKSAYDRIRDSLQIICPSEWLAGVARQAPLLEGIPVHTVPNPINTNVFKRIDKLAARRLLGLPDEGPLLLLGATALGDRRKGFDLLDEALKHYSEWPSDQPLGVVTLGMRNYRQLPQYHNLKTWNIGFLHDEVSLSALYNAVDVVALPSREENLSNALAESLSCGTPCLAFRIGGNVDLIEHQKNGYLARPYEPLDMANGLSWILQNLRNDQRDAISKLAHEKLAAEKLMPQFLQIYETALAKAGKPMRTASSLRRENRLELITHDPGTYHVSLDTVWEFEKAILTDPRVSDWSSKRNVLSKLPNLFWRNLYGAWGRLHQPEVPSPAKLALRKSKRDMFAVLMGPNVRKTMPRFLLSGRKSIYLFDAWPGWHEKIQIFADSCQIDHLFLTSSQGTQMLKERLKFTACHWIPEGINPENYRFVSPADKDIDVLQLGRRYDRYHNAVVDSLEKQRKVYLYEKQAGQIIFPTRDEYIDGLARSKLSICVPSNTTHPEIAGRIETMTVRYLQSMLSKCLIVGHAPQETIDLFGYNPVIEIDFADPTKQVLDLLKNLGDYTALIEKNYQTVLNHHTWKNRWDNIATILWE